MTHKELSTNPQDGIAQLYHQLAIPFTSRAKYAINKYASSKNPVNSGTDDPHNLYRNSAALVKNWKKRLSEDDIKRIREITEPVASQWYDDQDW